MQFYPARLRAPLRSCLPSSLVASSSLLSPDRTGARWLAGSGGLGAGGLGLGAVGQGELGRLVQRVGLVAGGVAVPPLGTAALFWTGQRLVSRAAVLGIGPPVPGVVPAGPRDPARARPGLQDPVRPDRREREHHPSDPAHRRTPSP